MVGAVGNPAAKSSAPRASVTGRRIRFVRIVVSKIYGLAIGATGAVGVERALFIRRMSFSVRSSALAA